jgi:tetratricopeptide (TPR) repeat protein
VLNSKHATVEDPRQAILDATGDAALATAITKAVRDKEAERFADAATFAEALARTVARPPTETRVPAPAPAPAPTSAPVPTRRRWLVAVAAFAITGGIAAAVGSRVLHRHPAVGPVAPRETTIAILPFENHVRDPRLDFASSGLAHLLGEQLGSIDHLHVLGYYRIRASVKNRDDRAAWRDAALKLGANMVVRGELEPVGDLARVSIMIERGDGSSLGRVAREIPIDQVPETVRALAASVATTALGAPTPSSPAITRAFDVERELQLGVAAFERQEFDAARGHLTAAVARDPALAEAYYYLALLDWWQGMEPQAHIQLALGGSLGKTPREFLVGLKLLWDQDYPRGVDYFRDLAHRAPDQRDVQYGLFEALYHGGHATEAIETYRRLRDLAPGFYVGIEHAMSYYLARGDVAGIRWTREHWDVPVAERARWDARAKMAEQDYPEAIRILERAQEEDPGAQSSIARDLIAAYAVTGQLALARELTARLAGDTGFRTLASYGLAIASGEDGAIWRKDAMPAVRAVPGLKPWESWFDLLSLDLVVGQPQTLREDLDVYATMDGHVPMVEFGLLILAQRLGQPREPSGPRVQVFPQAVAAATAIVADTRRDARAAAQAWRQVIALDDDGRIALHARTALALDLAELGDHAGVIAACDEVITPRAFTWAWSNGVGPCLRASAEAATALGRSDEARRYWQRLLALRSRAPADDELVRAARAGLAR